MEELSMEMLEEIDGGRGSWDELGMTLSGLGAGAAGDVLAGAIVGEAFGPAGALAGAAIGAIGYWALED